jgi:hypothetical protein
MMGDRKVAMASWHAALIFSVNAGPDRIGVRLFYLDGFGWQIKLSLQSQLLTQAGNHACPPLLFRGRD